MDIIVSNGKLIGCEIKSSANKDNVYMFWKKKMFYEEKHNRKFDKVMLISPMVDDKGKEAADRLGIEVYSYAEDIKMMKDK